HMLMPLTESRGLYLYIEIMKTALDDEIVTDDEAAIMKVLATALGISDDDLSDAIDVAKGIDPYPISASNDYDESRMGDASTYQSALIAALDDEVITEDEWAMIENLRTLLNIQPDEHALIEEAIIAMSETDENGLRRLERLERFNTVCPYN
ncbi:MAG: hypothetical protein VW862_08195, partial [Euryarchaeota archaeon]